MSTLSLGFFRAITSPDTPQPQNSTKTGYSVLTDLTVSCAAIQEEEETVLLFSCDIRNLSQPYLDAVMAQIREESGVPEDHILYSVTHNHSAPDISFYGKRPEVTDWVERIHLPAVRKATREALLDLAPVARITSGTSQVEHVAFVRRYLREDGAFSGIQMPKTSDAPLKCHETEADTELRALRFYREGKKDVVFCNFQVHAATALGTDPDLICADFLHPFRETAEAGGDFFVLYLQGGCGNLNTLSKLDPEAVNRDYKKAGVLIAQGLLRALENQEERQSHGLVIQRKFFTGIVNHTRDSLLEQAKAALAEAKTQSFQSNAEGFAFFAARGFTSRLDAGAVVTKSAMERTREIPLSTLCLGAIGMTFAPFEMFDTNCRQIREASPFAITLTVGYTGGRHHYLPSALSFANGGYEPLQCYYIPGTGESVALAFLGQLKEDYQRLQTK